MTVVFEHILCWRMVKASVQDVFWIGLGEMASTGRVLSRLFPFRFRHDASNLRGYEVHDYSKTKIVSDVLGRDWERVSSWAWTER